MIPYNIRFMNLQRRYTVMYSLCIPLTPPHSRLHLASFPRRMILILSSLHLAGLPMHVDFGGHWETDVARFSIRERG